MDNSEIKISNDIFKSKQCAELKDRLLNYMLDPKKVSVFDLMFKELNSDNLPKEEFERCLNEMIQDNMILSSSKSIYEVTKDGKIFIRDGGYIKLYQKDQNEGYEKLIEEKKRKEKLDLEIKNLKWGWWFSVAAIIISILALIVSIFIK
jgi:hypothetical protein